jgi:hypothetical protein
MTLNWPNVRKDWDSQNPNTWGYEEQRPAQPPVVALFDIQPVPQQW